MIAIHVLFNSHWNELPVLAIRSYIELRWGQEISSVGFKRVLLQADIDLNHLKTLVKTIFVFRFHCYPCAY